MHAERTGAGVQLKGSVVIVTGASAGIGEATAVAFAQRGARVVLTARRGERLEAMADRIRRAGGAALAVPCDVTDHHALRTLRGVVGEVFGPADVLVNNAGIPGGGDFGTLGYEQIRRIVEVNLLGVLYGTRAFLPQMLERRRGHVVNVASLAGRFAAPGAAVYAATKHGVVAFSESMNMNITSSPHGVLVTSVSPGFVPTEGFPATDRPRLLSITAEQVARTIVRVVLREIAPEYSIPRWVSAGQVLRVLAPGPYRWAIGAGERMYRTRPDRR